MGMFDFFLMEETYEERKIRRYENKNLIISTAIVIDSPAFAETAISHKQYNNGNWIVVENYENKKEAIKGHEKWKKKMTSKILPKNLTDISRAEIKQLCDVFSDRNDCVYTLKEKTKKTTKKTKKATKRRSQCMITTIIY